MSKRKICFILVGVAGLLFLGASLFKLSAAKSHAESINCASSITSICLAARLWAEDNGGIMATNFICMSNEICTPKILSCVASRRSRTEDWSTFTTNNCTYEIVSPGMQVDDTNTVFLRCTIHGHLGYSDGTVFDGVRRRTKFQ